MLGAHGPRAPPGSHERDQLAVARPGRHVAVPDDHLVRVLAVASADRQIEPVVDVHEVLAVG